MSDVAALTLAEEERQDAKWGQQDHPNGTGPSTQPLFDRGGFIDDDIAADELAVRFTARTDSRARLGIVTWRDIFLEEVFEALAESDPEKLAAELIQCAAVAQQWVRAIERARA